VVAVGGCGGPAPGPDGGADATRPDARALDAGPEDAGPEDAGPEDAGPGDAGLGDSGRDVGLDDAHTHAADDAGHDAAPVPDAAIDAGPPALHGCADFADRTAPDAERVVRFDSSPSLAYTPACIRIARGQSVAFEGPFSRHPLTPGRVPGREDEPPGTEPTPITAVEAGLRAEFTFPEPGLFPYFCPIHAASGMVGVVAVE
jgi:plastocyanin